VFTGSLVPLAGGVVFTALIAYAALMDVRMRRIPNRVVAILAVTGFVFSVYVEGGAGGILRGAAGLGVGLACWLPFHMVRWLGAGDVKLFAAAGCWLGATRALEGALVAALAGAGLALVWMVWMHGVRRTASTLSVATAAPGVLLPSEDDRRRRRAMPYGVALAVGALVAGWLPRTLLF
jgi:prepilin peptidase CpaA